MQFLVVAGIRARYPFELEWIEGAYVDQARRAPAGLPLYPSPTISYIPLNKTPVFFVLSGVLMPFTGVGFLGPRFVSIVATVGCLILLARIVVFDSGLLAAGIIAAGFHAAAFEFTGAWMDLAKTDSLMMFLVLAAFFVSRRYSSRPGMVVAGICWVAAYYTKQTALPIILVTAPASLLASRGRTWSLWSVVCVLGPLIFLALDSVNEGWFSLYTFNSLTYHERVRELLLFWKAVVARLWPALLLGLLYPALVFRVDGIAGLVESDSVWQNVGFCAALLAASWSVYVKVWTYENGLIPACIDLAMLAGLGYARGVKFLLRSPRWLVHAGMLALVLCQFVLLAYNPLEQVPGSTERDAWSQSVDRIRGLEGEALVFHHGFVNHLAGEATYLHSSPFGDVVGWGQEAESSDHEWRQEETKRVLAESVAQQSFGWIVSGGSEDRWSPYYLLTNQDPFVAPLLTGAPATPEFFFVRNPVARGGEFPLKETAFDFLLGQGWHAPEPWGRWADGRNSTMQVALENGDYELTLDVFPFCAPELDGQAMEVGWNDRSLGHYVFSSCESRSVRVALPSQTVNRGLNTLWFRFERAMSPSDEGLSADERTLSMGFTRVAFARAGEQ